MNLFESLLGSPELRRRRLASHQLRLELHLREDDGGHQRGHQRAIR